MSPRRRIEDHQIEVAIFAVLGTAILTIAICMTSGFIDLTSTDQWMRSHAFTASLFAIGIAALFTSFVYSLNEGETPGLRRTLGGMRWYLIVLVVLLAVLNFIVATWLIDQASTATDPSAARVEAVRSIITIAVGSGGLVALLLTLRRQLHQEDTASVTFRLQEQVAADTKHDATERRVKDVLVAAVEQLGAPNPLARMAGAQLLERLGQNTPELHQTVVDLLCAYLRAPFGLAEMFECAHASPLQRSGALQRICPACQTKMSTDTWVNAVRERDVRLAIQGVLTQHLNPSLRSTFWPQVDIDLTAATLIDFSLTSLSVRKACLRESQFYGASSVHNFRVGEVAIFDDATFHTSVDLTKIEAACGLSTKGVRVGKS